ncbi:hypothetical protein BFZC1_10352 [Lysinibacillus fusiformis ZC1]|nr:hypothetical protein BFZC1_10352 [Lysinibacillus fusiformis ZC1]
MLILRFIMLKLQPFQRLFFTKETLKAVFRNYLMQAVDKKLIDISHLDKFNAGTLTNGDLKG